MLTGHLRTNYIWTNSDFYHSLKKKIVIFVFECLMTNDDNSSHSLETFIHIVNIKAKCEIKKNSLEQFKH